MASLLITLIFDSYVFKTVTMKDMDDLCIGLHGSGYANIVRVVNIEDYVKIELRCIGGKSEKTRNNS